MRKSVMHPVVLLVLFAVLMIPSMVQASGFYLYEYSNRGNALGGTLVGRADDPSALAFNPAGITQLDGWGVEAGVTFIEAGGDIQTTNQYTGVTSTTSVKNNIVAVPHFYITNRISERFAAGVGVFTRFGLSSEFDPNWDGRYNSYKAAVQSFSINPNIAYKLTNHLSVAAGVEFMKFDLNLRQKLDATRIFAAQGAPGLAFLAGLGLPTTVNDPSTSALDVDQHLNGDSWGYGFNLALHWKPVEAFALGITYRGEVRQELKGTAYFDKSATVDALLPVLYNQTGIRGNIDLPDVVAVGLMYKPVDKVSLGGTVTWTRWSNYDKLTISYETNAVGLTEVSSVKDYSDTWRLEFGVEYTPVDWLDLRAGYIYDESPINGQYADYLLPSNDRQLVTLGLGFRFLNGWQADVSYCYLWAKNRDIGNRQVESGVLQGQLSDPYAHLFGATVSYRF